MQHTDEARRQKWKWPLMYIAEGLCYWKSQSDRVIARVNLIVLLHRFLTNEDFCITGLVYLKMKTESPQS